MTKKLPLVEVEQNALIPLFGKNTKEAIAAGVIRGVVFELKGYMRTPSEQGTEFVGFATGGHAPYILNGIKESMRHEPHLVLIGLNRILEYNIDKH